MSKYSGTQELYTGCPEQKQAEEKLNNPLINNVGNSTKKVTFQFTVLNFWQNIYLF